MRNAITHVEQLFDAEIDPAALAPLRGGVPADGLLLGSIRNAPLRIDIPIATDPEETVPDWDGFQLFVDGTLYGTRVDVTDQHLNDGKVSIEIAAADRVEKGEKEPYRIGYRKWKGPEVIGEFSDWPGTVAFIVDLTPPGPRLSKPLIDPAIVNGGLTPARLTELGDKVPAEIYSYGSQALGDDVYLIIEDSDGIQHPSLTPITRDNMSSEFFVDYPRTLIEQAVDGPVQFRYKVQDRAGHMSTDSDPEIIRVLLSGYIDDLLAPSVPVFDANDIIVDEDARAGVLVEIPFHSEIEAGDQIVVVWGGRRQLPVDLLAGDLQDPLWGPGGGVAVPYDEVLASLSGATRGTVSVSYEVLRDGGSIGASPDLENVLIDLTLPGGPDPDPDTPESEQLRVLTIRPPSGTGADNVIPSDQFGDDATAIIPWENVDGDPVFEERDVIQVLWNGVEALATPYEVTADDVTNGAIPDLTVPGSVISDGGGNPALPVQYTVTRALQPPPNGKSNTVLAPPQPVDVQSPDDLPGGPAGLLPGDFPLAQGTVGNRVVTKPVAQEGTLFQVGHYLNQAEKDSVYLEAQAYLGMTGTANPVGSKYEWTVEVEAGKENDPVELPVPEAFFFISELDKKIGHVVATYTVTQDKPNPIPVKSEEVTAIIDVRGWTS
ncbi:hypothetical protein WJ73_05180 [Burkholderia ubonensis]|nr:hypothetical protein WJ73_05180 [Burkholderia ubonensis]